MLLNRQSIENRQLNGQKLKSGNTSAINKGLVFTPLKHFPINFNEVITLKKEMFLTSKLL